MSINTDAEVYGGKWVMADQVWRFRLMSVDLPPLTTLWLRLACRSHKKAQKAQKRIEHEGIPFRGL